MYVGMFKILKKLHNKNITHFSNNTEIYRSSWHKTTYCIFFLLSDDQIEEGKRLYHKKYINILNFYTKKVMLSNKDIFLGFKNKQVPKTRLNYTL